MKKLHYGFAAILWIVLMIFPTIESNETPNYQQLLTQLSTSFYTPTSIANKPYRIRRVVIDAGHGGKDTGCTGKKSIEKKVTLAIALKLGKYIEDNLSNVKVIYTRKTDVFVELDERANIANRNNADLFISIHCNSSPTTPSVKGTETYVMGLNKSKENLEVAMRENAVVSLEKDYKKKYNGFDINNPENDIIFSLYQNAHLSQSIQLASLVEKQFKLRANRHSRGVKQESFLVLYQTAMPSILIESGFLSNSEEERYLLSDNGQSLIASAVYRAFKSYKQQLENAAVTPSKTTRHNQSTP